MPAAVTRLNLHLPQSNKKGVRAGRHWTSEKLSNELKILCATSACRLCLAGTPTGGASIVAGDINLKQQEEFVQRVVLRVEGQDGSSRAWTVFESDEKRDDYICVAGPPAADLLSAGVGTWHRTAS